MKRSFAIILVCLSFWIATQKFTFNQRSSIFTSLYQYKYLSVDLLNAKTLNSDSKNNLQVINLSDDTNTANINRNTNRSCEYWAVVTTINKPTESVRLVARDSVWCLVVVADQATPSKKDYMTGIKVKRNRFVFLSPTDQEIMFPLLSSTIPWNHFQRKNIGYMYAIKHGARMIWDFDDDNVRFLNTGVFKTFKKYKTACKVGTYAYHLFNPYPYFSSKDSNLWPRGFPIQQIRNKLSTPPLCTSEEKVAVGIVQSLANIEPDVDAIFRLTRKTPFNFDATPQKSLPVLVPKNAYTPFNGQATLWTKNTLHLIPLPVSVSVRVTDIWRSYIAEYFLHKTNQRIMFVPPYVDQHRNLHDIGWDFNQEILLYKEADAFTKWLSSNPNIANSLSELYEHLVALGFLGESDMPFISAWIRTLKT